MMPLRYSPWRDLASRPHLHLLVAPTGDPDVWGYFEPDTSTVTIDSGCDQVERRCTLAHELAHVDRGDEAHHTADYPEAERQTVRDEAAADDLAARRLIPLDRLADALMPDDDLWRAAADLDVDHPMLCARLRGLTDEEHAAVWADLNEREAGLPWA